jgi:hypothetical protein
VIVNMPVRPKTIAFGVIVAHEPCCGSEGDDPEATGSLSVLSQPEDGEQQGEVRSLRMSDSEAGSLEVPTTTVVDK